MNSTLKQNDAQQDTNGVWRWKSNNRVPFNDMLQSWGIAGAELAKHEAARDVDTDAFLRDYREAQRNRTPEQLAEEAFEARAAFGPGVEYVNVITGERRRM